MFRPFPSSSLRFPWKSLLSLWALATSACLATTRPAPRSLLEFAGAPRHTVDSTRAALLIIDAQEEYVRGDLPLAGVDEAIAEAARVRRWAQSHGVPVFHIVHQGAPGAAVFNPEGPFVSIVSALTPEPGEPVLIKRLPNAFAGTELHEWLKQLGRTELVLVGFATHMCVSSTARAALDLGYRTTVVARATATRDLSDGKGGSIPAAWVQASALAELGDRFASVVQDVGALPTSRSRDALALQWVGGPTFVLESGPFRLLADPMFGEGPAAFVMTGHPSTGAARADIAREGPLPPVSLQGLDAVVLSHLHTDHFDAAAIAALPKDLLVIAHREHAATVEARGFRRVRGLAWGEELVLERGGERLRITAVPARHAHDALNREMGVINSYVIARLSPTPATVYWTRDTV